MSLFIAWRGTCSCDREGHEHFPEREEKLLTGEVQRVVRAVVV
jgi:hypothetical protein